MMTLPANKGRLWLALAEQRRRRRRRAALVPALPVTLLTELAGYWKLEEPANAPRLDASGNGWDLSEWSFAEASGGGHVPVRQTTGVVNFAADFSAGAGGPALVSFAPNTLLAGDFTFAVWVGFFSGAEFEWGLISVGGSVLIGIRPFDDRVTFGVQTAGGLAQIETGYGALVEYDWNQVVCMKAGQTLRIYVNGGLSADGAFNGNLLPTAAPDFFGPTDLVLGAGTTGYPFVGQLDEFGCWQRALSAAEVGRLYNYGSGLPLENF